MANFQVDALSRWEPFEHAGQSCSLGHLDAHEVVFQKEEGKEPIRFVVTYGLHCFTKDDTDQNIPLKYADGRESRTICLERYEASKWLRGMIEKLDVATIYQVQGEVFFTITVLNTSSGQLEPFKICMAIFRENRLLRIHVTSAFFARTGEGSPGVPVQKKGLTIFKVAFDTQHKLRTSSQKKSGIGLSRKNEGSRNGESLSRRDSQPSIACIRRGRSFLRRARRTGCPVTGCAPFGAL
ncbi:hypothetical protein [Pseudomonas sp. G2-4]|uniref:hypothetical protein n=1 Tax=Pseudomonas sp. G2-4 TaxID=1506334 RepID=UPI0024BAAD2E|nr:hypothetical protein [Pseudomonas sp. G2-4]WHS59378.1 hypothetical protein QNH97_23505 [Pseudomonas sp. G2-4]